MTIIFGTGHRPEDAGMDYLHMFDLVLYELANYPREIKAAVCGMAAGFDLAFGMAALNLSIDVWSVRPWAGHQARGEDRRRYDWIEKNATRHIITNDSLSYPGRWVYQTRNQWMVDNSDEGMAFWNGRKAGGTFNCLEYAKKVKVPVTNIYQEA